MRSALVPTIRVKVKFNGVYHEIYINSQASFGELKKMMSAKTGLHPEDQKLVYKDRERDSKAFLDMAGVRDRSKMVLLVDPAAQAKRLLEQRRTDKAERAAKSISRISLDVDKLATKVSALETIVGKGGKVVDADVVTLTEALMNELVKLDSIAADGERRPRWPHHHERQRKHENARAPPRCQRHIRLLHPLPAGLPVSPSAPTADRFWRWETKLTGGIHWQ
ncbi:BAG family molecular chaperone regulator 2-like [Panicum miliaceum]|uniref:BAG family molecular chaperone regulator 2-like n=1 Tax=Panicum miliaceum TaxID=4540 RepID=A0A3L6SYW1_PANMI|nr:BAG family molecular chaperone regulator 2-like [Panicum miliaceum]